MNGTGEDSANLDAYLISFVHRSPQATEQFLRIAGPYLLNLAHNFASDLPRDLHKEIVEQTYINLLASIGIRFNPRRGSAKAFLYDAVRNSTRQVRAQYCPPGQTTRNRQLCDWEKQGGNSQRKQSIIASISEVEEMAATRNTADEIMARCDARTILNKAPCHVAVALYRIYFVGELLDEAAHHIGINRFKLKRLINAYSAQFREVA